MLRALRRLLQVPDKLALFGLMRGMQGQMRCMTAAALVRLGAMQRMREPIGVTQLADACGVMEPELLQNLLDLAVRLKLLRCNGEGYAVRGRLARALAREGENPIASMLLEATSYHHDVFANLPARLRGEPPRDYLAEHGGVVAVSSRIMEPWVIDYCRRIHEQMDGARVLLDLGCGSGRFLTEFVRWHHANRGVGLEMDPQAQAVAEAACKESVLSDRISIKQGDMRRGLDWPSDTFNLITAHQNVYYLTAEERCEVWRIAQHHLAEGGRLALVTPTAGGPMSDYFALVLGSTDGCQPLPEVSDLIAELESVGFEDVKAERLIPGDSVYGISTGPLAKRPVPNPWWHARKLYQATCLLTEPASIQLACFDERIDRVGEVLSAFSDAYLVLWKLIEVELVDHAAVQTLQRIEEHMDEFVGADDSVWEEGLLDTHPQWVELRELARLARVELERLGLGSGGFRGLFWDHEYVN